MQEPHRESQPSKEGEEGFSAISDHELISLLENRHSKATKTATNWAVSTFKGRYILYFY